MVRAALLVEAAEAEAAQGAEAHHEEVEAAAA